MRKSNYDKYPATAIEGVAWKGWDAIRSEMDASCHLNDGKKRHVLVVECYQGVYHEEVREEMERMGFDKVILTANLFRPAAEVEAMTHRFLTDDRIFGYRPGFLTYADFLDPVKVEACRIELANATGRVLVYGHGAAEVVTDPDTLAYADMARWEIQMRSRRKEVCGLGVENCDEAPSFHYKRGYFIDWQVCDALKKRLMPKVDYWLDTHVAGSPRMITADTFCRGLEKTASQPFRVVPFFDPAPWGGQWMKEVCDLDKSQDNFGWCFDCVPEENSLFLDVSGDRFEMPSNNLVFHQTRALLGATVEARFGQDFPIRFDFLDTMGGGHLSLQVHPTTQYIRETFGMDYTQDESYYLLDADDQATVYLGLRTDVNPDEMIAALNEAQTSGIPFDTDKYVNKWPAKRHDHFLIPAGTVHCSGSGAMVLEISATPSIFTFKLWDWGRVGLDGLPRPINIGHGSKVIQWERQTEYTRQHLVSPVQAVAEGDGWQEERTGLHENEFIETRRHWFDSTVPHQTDGGVQVLNVIEGDELVLESPTGAFQPFVVHYAETFIIPASVGAYTIRPCGASEGKRCGTIKAYVRFRQ